MKLPLQSSDPRHITFLNLNEHHQRPPNHFIDTLSVSTNTKVNHSTVHSSINRCNLYHRSRTPFSIETMQRPINIRRTLSFFKSLMTSLHQRYCPFYDHHHPSNTFISIQSSTETEDIPLIDTFSSMNPMISIQIFPSTLPTEQALSILLHALCKDVYET